MRSRTSSAGQASLEFIGVVALLVVMLVGAGAWLATNVTPPAAPPPIVEQVWPGPDTWSATPGALPDLGLSTKQGRPSAVERFGKRALRAARKGGRLVAVGVRAFAGGFATELMSSIDAFVRDPIGTIMGGGELVAVALRDPAGFTAAQLAAVRAYAAHLGSLSSQEAYETVMRDLGGLSADLAVARGKQLAHKALVRALRRKFATPSGAGPPPVGGPEPPQPVS